MENIDLLHKSCIIDEIKKQTFFLDLDWMLKFMNEKFLDFLPTGNP